MFKSFLASVPRRAQIRNFYRSSLLALAVIPCLLTGEEGEALAITPVATELKVRMPEWRPKIFEQYPNNAPKLVIFYAENDQGEEEAVKRIHFYENGRPFEEADLTIVDEKSPGFEAWKSTVVPHGAAVSFGENGELERVLYYDRGILHGPVKVFYPQGQLRHLTTFNQGKPEGKIISYYENGQISTEGQYKDGELIGDYVRYYSNGEREALIPYFQGKMHGKVIEWYDNGNEKAEYRYVSGLLHGANGQPAVIKYDMNHAIVEVQDFNQGVPSGDHIQYHPNERQSYYVHYVDGNKDGVEKWFGLDGKLLGEAEFIQGKKVGKHWKKHDNGTMAYLATYDKKGRLKEPIREFNENGQKTAEYSVNLEGKYDGKFQAWHSDGSLKINAFYVNGEFEGEQKEFYPSGQLKILGNYKNQTKNGIFKEWFEDGKLAFQGNFVDGNKEGEFADWYPNGQLRTKTNYKTSLYHGDQGEWYQDGTSKFEGRYVLGKKDGTFRTWGEDKQLLFEGAFDQDKPIGTHVGYYSNGHKMEVVHFLDGKKEGKHEQFFENGNLRLVETFKNDLLEGEAIGYYEDGSEAFIRNFKEGKYFGRQKEFFAPALRKGEPLASLYCYNENGEFQGEQKTFYPSGAIKTSLSYENGLLHGLKALWDEAGNLLEESKFLQGKLEGHHFEKDPEGREITYNYKNNKREGPHYVYYPTDVTNGEKVKALEAMYQNNKLHGEAIEYNPNGGKIRVVTYKEGLKDGQAEAYHRNGKIAMRLSFKNDRAEGPYYEFYPNGQLHKEVQLIGDQKNGEEKTYFEDGRPKSIYSYHAGKLEGNAKQWNESGILIFEAEYKDGQQHGKFIKFFDNGKPRLEQYFLDGKLDGEKKSYDQDGKVTVTTYKNGVKVST